MTRECGTTKFSLKLIQLVFLVGVMAVGFAIFGSETCLAEINCSGDYNFDGDVDGADLADLLGGPVDPAAVSSQAVFAKPLICGLPDRSMSACRLWPRCRFPTWVFS